MKKILVAAFSLMCVSSAACAAQSNTVTGGDEDSIAPIVTPKKVNMRAGQLGNLRGTMVVPKAGVAVAQPESTQDDEGKAGANASTADTGNQPAVKVGKYLPSNRNAAQNPQIPGVAGTEDSIEGGGKVNYKNINKRSTEMADGFD